MKTNIPQHARTVRYCYGRYKGNISVWKSDRPGPEKWCWAALGNDGEVEGDMWAAVSAAREWIINFKTDKENAQ